MCRDHRCLTTCQKQHRLNEQAGWVDIATGLEIRMTDTCRDHRCLTSCQKQYRQNVPAGQIDVPTWVEVHVMGSRSRVLTTDVSPPVKNNTDRMNQLVR